MFEIKGSDIYLTRGDSAQVTVGITDTAGQAYTPAAGDRLKLTVKRSTREQGALIVKEAAAVEAVLAINPADTKTLAFGRYIYDIELATAAGAVHTIIGPAAFNICEEVG